MSADEDELYDSLTKREAGAVHVSLWCGIEAGNSGIFVCDHRELAYTKAGGR